MGNATWPWTTHLFRGLLAIVMTITSLRATLGEVAAMLTFPASSHTEANIDYQSTCQDVVEQARPTAESPLVVQVVTKSFIRMQANFIMAWKRASPHRLDSLYLLCVDEDAWIILEAVFRIRCVRASLGENRGAVKMWRLRVKVMACLVQSGRDVMLSDNDALWLMDPVSDLRDIDADILAQRAMWPSTYADPKYGTTMCMGFSLFRARGEGMSEFLRKFTQTVNKIGDDQIALNQVAWELGMSWDYANSDIRPVNSSRFGYATLKTSQGNLTVALLPASKYVRHCGDDIDPQVVVAHCHAQTKQGGLIRRESEMKHHGTWFLD